MAEAGTSDALTLRPIAACSGSLARGTTSLWSYPTRLRPDWFLPVAKSGILLEVERGKTLANNVDLLDLWKCHICREADHLFLVVPVKVQRTGARRTSTRALYPAMSTFVIPENKVNVVSIAVLGY